MTNSSKILSILFTSLFLLQSEPVSGGDSSESDFFTAECLENFDTTGIPEYIQAQLIRAEQEIPHAEKLVNTKDPETEALAKRLEITSFLIASIKEDLKLKSKDTLLFAWQKAEELKILLDYFSKEKKRLESLQKLAPSSIISVRDYGAVGDGQTDDGPAFQRTLDAASQYHGKPVIVKIPAGTYLIENHHDKNGDAYIVENPLPDTSAITEKSICRENRKKVHLLLLNVKNLTVEGEMGTHLRFADPVAIGVRVMGGENVRLKNFSMDYTKLPFTQGTILAIDEQTAALTIKIDSGYPSPRADYFLNAPERRLTPHDPQGRFGLTTYRVGKVESIDQDTFRIYPFKTSPGVSPWNQQELGLKADIIARYDPFEYDAYAIDLRYCKFCTIENVTVHSSPAGAFRNMLTYAIAMIGNRVDVPEKSTRLISTNADGSQSRGLIAPFIKNCIFNYLEDDGINLNSTTPEATEISDDRKSLTPEINGAGWFVNSISGQVHAIARFANGKSSVSLPEQIKTRKGMQWKDLSHAEKLALGFYNGTNPQYAERPDRIITIPSLSNGGVITSCSFQNIRGLGIQITAPNTLVENCRFSGNSGAAMHINAMLGWGMVFNTHNVIVRNCKFQDFRRTAISCSYHQIGNDRILSSRQLRNIRFENNIFIQGKKEAMLLQNSSGIILKDNQFLKTSTSPFVIKINNSSNYTGEGNRFSYPEANPENTFLPSSVSNAFQNSIFENLQYCVPSE